MLTLPLWRPTRQAIAQTALDQFRKTVGERFGASVPDSRALHGWSVEHRAEFWDLLWDFVGVIGEKGEDTLIEGDRMPGAQFFPGAKLNFAENLLRQEGDAPALIFRGEDKTYRTVSFAELGALVSRMQQGLLATGVGVGDRVAAILPNLPEAVALMLATTSIGAIFSSCSPDFGERGVLDRFGQIEPKVLVGCDGYWYAGKPIDIADKIDRVVDKLAHGTKLIVVPYLAESGLGSVKTAHAIALDQFLAPYKARSIQYTRLPFDHPIYVLYSSGTTGVPKCIVHGAGGTLLQHLKEHRLHCNLTSGERLFYFTTLGWMMWNWLVSGLASGATLCLYDGSPFAPDAGTLFRYAETDRINVFGTSAKYIEAVRKVGLKPGEAFDLSSVRMITSTGSPLAPEGFDFVYRAIKPDVHLASISGGTDIVSCFVLGDPTQPVWRGEIQSPALGMAVDVWSDDGKPIRGERGELVCTKAFPSMPVKFWNDPEGKKYRGAYFDRFPGVWHHGDFAEWTEHGGIIIHGRSDTTLNPGGVRIGTAEIYAQVEEIMEVAEAIAIAQEWEGDVRIVLFVRMQNGAVLDGAMIDRIKRRIREGASPRHVPAKIIAVSDIPRTRSGKITEIAVREIVHGRPVKNTEALANPEALELYRNLPELSR